jgi:flavin-binding protein dodecin
MVDHPEDHPESAQETLRQIHAARTMNEQMAIESARVEQLAIALRGSIRRA